MNEIWVSLGSFVAGGGLLKIGEWLLNRKKSNIETSIAEADCLNKEIHNAIEMVKFWREQNETLRDEIHNASAIIDQLTEVSNKFKIHLNIAKSLITEATCETLSSVKEQINKL